MFSGLKEVDMGRAQPVVSSSLPSLGAIAGSRL